jgi:S-adenosylmethionine hydrolase
LPVIVSFTSDFGLTDTYVGQVKAAILSVAAQVTVVDVTHAVPPFNVRSGAFLLGTAVTAFPPASLHLAIVDPGVGSTRRGLAISTARGDVLVGPDNGLLLPAAEVLGGPRAIHELTAERLWRPTVSPVFHGRDLFGPTVGHLAGGLPLTELGPVVTDPVPAPWPRPRHRGGHLIGEVLHVDQYGNAVTNLPAAELPERFALTVGTGRPLLGPARTYTDVAPGEPVALIGSSGYLEIAAREANGAQILGLHPGDEVIVLAQAPRELEP